jgi:predicted PurR-regulated permease PerM
VAAALSWRLLLIIAAVGVVAWILGQLAPVTVPVGIALLASGLFAPLVERLVRWRVPRGLATMIAIIVGFAVVGGVFTLIISTVLANLPQLQGQLAASLDTINNWLQHGPLRLSQAQLQRLLNDATNTIKGNTSELPTRALSTAAAVGSILTETLLTLFTLIFFLYGGAQVWRFALRIIPGGIRDQVDVAGRRGFASLVAYVRATVAVAVVDASCIGVGIWVVGVPLAAPLAALIFIGAFVPIIGAVIAGVVAVLVALVAKGFLAAVVVVAILVGVMQPGGPCLAAVPARAGGAAAPAGRGDRHRPRGGDRRDHRGAAGRAAARGDQVRDWLAAARPRAGTQPGQPYAPGQRPPVTRPATHSRPGNSRQQRLNIRRWRGLGRAIVSGPVLEGTLRGWRPQGSARERRVRPGHEPARW